MMRNNEGKFVFRKNILKFKLSTIRWKFWAYMMDNYPKFYKWVDKWLPIDTLPF